MTNVSFRFTAVSAPAPCAAGVLQASAPLETLADPLAAALAELFDGLSDRAGAAVAWQIEDASDTPPKLEGVTPLDIDPLPNGASVSPMFAAFTDSVPALASALQATWHVTPEVFPLEDARGIEEVRRYHADLLAAFGGIDSAQFGSGDDDVETELVDAALEVLAAQANLGYWPHRPLVKWATESGAHVLTSAVDGLVDEICIVTTRPDLEARCRDAFAAAGVPLQ